MKLTKKQEAEILKVYNGYWAGYLKGDIARMAALLDHKYTQVGSAETEVFFNKKDAVKFLRDTIDQVAGQLEMRNRVIRKERLEASVLINEQCDLYAKSGKKWIFFSKFSASTTLHEKGGKWKIIHQHSSFPDLRAQAGENIALEKVEEENVKLKDAIKRRTIELEEKNHELKIEVSLERVRARSMAMQKSEELKEVIQVVYDQFGQLKIDVEHTGFIIDYKTKDEMHIWLADQHKIPAEVSIPYFDSPHWNSFIEAKKKRKNFFTNQLNFKTKNKFYRDLFKLIPGVSQKIIKYYLSCPGLAVSTVLLDNVGLYIENFSGTPYTDEENKILIRFGKVFQQTYTRFLDLQKAEAQARESQIQLALERVRARTMSMHKSDELIQTAELLFEQLKQLGVESQGVAFAICDTDSTIVQKWTSIGVFSIPITFEPGEQLMYEAWKKQVEIYEEVYEGDRIRNYYELFMQIPAFKEGIQQFVNSGYPLPAWQKNHAIPFKYGYLLVITTKVFEETNIFVRFAKVFEQTYTRFLDLQKAEAQVREAQIQLALERVRARTMAMQKSDELADAAIVLFSQVKDLGIKTWTTGFNVWSDDNNYYEDYITSPQGGFIQPYIVDSSKASALKEVSDVRKRGDEFFVQYAEGERLKEAYIQLAAFGDEKQYDKMLEDGVQFPSHQYDHFVFGSKVSLMFITYEPVPEAHDIFKRFGKVFEQTYTRFLDLQKAEEQAREAQIEVALERVRARTMGMQRSEDLKEVVKVLYEQLSVLGFQFGVASIIIMDASSGDINWWMEGFDDGYDLPDRYRVPYFNHKGHNQQLDYWKNGNTYAVIEISGKEKKSYDHYYFNQTDFAKAPENTKQLMMQQETVLFSMAYMQYGALSWSPSPLSVEQARVLERFAKVFEQTYTRFLDLQKAEAQAREAVKQSSLDRVRGEIASMRTMADLDRITPLIWKELTTLGISFIRCGVFIMDEKENKVHTYLSSPDGNAIAAFHTPMDDSGSLAGTIDSWRQQKVFVTRWVDSDFQLQADILLEQGSITSRDQYLSSIPKEGFHLHFLPFRQGMLYVGSNEQLPNDALQLVQSLADAFSTAYARYEDFNKLEAAKQQVDKTLVDLKQTQQQLVQSEKMASLGELTAGIAHEIQNPLNFVNNFSEVSNELIQEIQDIRRKTQDEKSQTEEDQLLNDIASNLEKILHHGKRAEGIVKGMLQHSRTSSGQKEPTDINALCDEYLRLSYHGLRAKDKSFNAKFETDFDQSLPKINIVPQDIGRVVLNLINNAFYAVSEKTKLQAAGYEPQVVVTTKKDGDKILISVKDNGNGIPDSIKEKIFQPFFTTKPTGQGTGLGLSLSYDIVKAHGGELKVETREGEGTEFTIIIPLNYVN